MELLGKNPPNYENIHDETCVYQQKPIKINDFIKTEEKDCVEIRKIKKREVAEKNKLLKNKRKWEENKKSK